MPSMTYEKTELNVYEKGNINNEPTNDDLVEMITKLYNGGDKNNRTYFVQEEKEKCNHLIKMIFRMLFEADIDNKKEKEKEKDNKKEKDRRSACVLKMLVVHNKIYEQALSRYFTESERKEIEKEIRLLKLL